MTEPGIEGVPTTVRPQPPLISNYGLVVTVYILYLFGFPTAITALVGVIIAYLQQKQHRSSMPVAFSLSDKNILDRIGLSRGRASNDTHCDWRVRFAMVGHLGTDQVRKGSPRIEYRRADTQSELMVVW